MSGRVVSINAERNARKQAKAEGLPLPHSEQLELTALATVLTATATRVGTSYRAEACPNQASEKLAIIQSICEPTDFFLYTTRTVYQAMLDIDATGITWDAPLLAEQLRRTGQLDKIGGPNFLLQIINETPVVENLREHCKVLAKYGQRRRMAALGMVIATEARADLFEDANEEMRHIEAGRDPVVEWLRSCVTRVEAVAQSRTDERPRRIGEVLPEIVNAAYAMARQAEDGAPPTAGIPTKLGPLDELTGGLGDDGEYLMVCGKPGQGKTSLMTDLCVNTAEQSVWTSGPDGKTYSRWRSALIFSLEMPIKKITARMVCQRGRCDFFKIKNGRASGEELARFAKTCDEIRDISIYVDDAKGLGPVTLKSKVRAWLAECDKRDEEPSLVAIDYFQLMRDRAVNARGGSREDELNTCAKAVKDFSDELYASGRRISFILAAQLNKAGAIKHCESGNEHAAYRWDIDHDKPKGPVLDAVPARVKVLKARFGSVGTVGLWFHPRYTHFSDSNL